MVVTLPQDAPDVAVEVSAQKNAPENSDNGRAGLMAAIRNAGGSGKAGLKSVCKLIISKCYSIFTSVKKGGKCIFQQLLIVFESKSKSDQVYLANWETR